MPRHNSHFLNDVVVKVSCRLDAARGSEHMRREQTGMHYVPKRVPSTCAANSLSMARRFQAKSEPKNR